MDVHPAKTASVAMDPYPDDFSIETSLYGLIGHFLLPRLMIPKLSRSFSGISVLTTSRYYPPDPPGKET